MRELTMTETETAAGGAIPVILAGIGISVASAYVYEKIGGAEGIEKAAKAVANAVVEVAKGQANTCKSHAISCLPVLS